MLPAKAETGQSHCSHCKKKEAWSRDQRHPAAGGGTLLALFQILADNGPLELFSAYIEREGLRKGSPGITAIRRGHF